MANSGSLLEVREINCPLALERHLQAELHPPPANAVSMQCPNHLNALRDIVINPVF